MGIPSETWHQTLNMSFEYVEYCDFILGIRRCVLLVTELLATFKINIPSI